MVAEAQRRTEAQLQTLSARVDDLAEAQRHTEQRLDGLSTEVGNLQRAFGATIEEEAESFVRALLEEKGYRLLAAHHSVVIESSGEKIIDHRGGGTELLHLSGSIRERIIRGVRARREQQNAPEE